MTAVATNTSGSWQLGSPLPTPMIRPGPSSAKVTLFAATGTVRPWASRMETVTTDTSSPSAWIAARSGASCTTAGVPVVSTFVSTTTCPPLKPFAESVPGA